MSDEKPNPYPPELKALNAAIASAQGEFPTIAKDKTARAGSYSYDYASLSTIIAACRPVLSKHGLAVVQKLEDPSGRGPALRTELRHADGGVIAASFPLGVFKTPQELGRWVTYLRRYAYCALLGIAAEEDDDGRSVAPVPGAATGAGASPRPDTVVTESQGPSESQFVPPRARGGAARRGGSDRGPAAQDLRHPHEADRRRPLHGGQLQGAAGDVVRGG